jgi:hypothetical protein
MAAGSFALPGQTAGVPAEWTGTWVLDVQRSAFGRLLTPGAPANWNIVSQTLKIKQAARKINLSGDTVVSDSGGPRSGHEDNSLSLDGRDTVIGIVSLSFRRIDDSTFEIVTKLNIPDRNIGELSRFSFSTDGRMLTETKTQTEREVVPSGSDTSTGAVMKTSTFILVFDKIAER